MAILLTAIVFLADLALACFIAWAKAGFPRNII
jgi:hypothetical protein